MGTISVRQGDTVWGLLKQAGLRDRELPAELASIAELNQTTVAGLGHLAPEARLYLPDRIARRLPADRQLEAFQGGARSGVAARQPVGGAALGMMAQPGPVLAQAEKALPRLFRGFALMRGEALLDRAEVSLQAKGGQVIEVVLQLEALGADPTITLRDEATGFHVTSPLDVRDVKASLADAKGRWDRVHALAAAGVAVTAEDTPVRPSALAPRFTAAIEVERGAHHRDGLTFDWMRSSVTLADAETGRASTALSNQAEIDELRAIFDGDAEDDWSIESTLTPNGGVGPFAGFTAVSASFLGGMRPDATVSYATIDARTGDRLQLDDLLGEAGARELVDSALSVALAIDEDAAIFIGLPESAAETARRSFLLFVEDGVAKVALGISGYGPARGMALDVALALPRTPELYARLGLAEPARGPEAP